MSQKLWIQSTNKARYQWRWKFSWYEFLTSWNFIIHSLWIIQMFYILTSQKWNFLSWSLLLKCDKCSKWLVFLLVSEATLRQLVNINLFSMSVNRAFTHGTKVGQNSKMAKFDKTWLVWPHSEPQPYLVQWKMNRGNWFQGPRSKNNR